VARGDIVTVVAGGDYGSKPRPAVIIQGDEFIDNPSVTVCLLTSTSVNVSAVRPQIDPSVENGLREVSWVMIDKIVTLRVAKVGRHIGRLGAADMLMLDRALAIFLDLPG
jgi:mRNA interferase MazF